MTGFSEDSEAPLIRFLECTAQFGNHCLTENNAALIFHSLSQSVPFMPASGWSAQHRACANAQPSSLSTSRSTLQIVRS